MATARHVVGILKSSDGRIRVKTLSGVSVLVAVIALLVGVLPAIADHSPAGPKVGPIEVNYGGGSGACAAILDGRLPSAAGKEFHINNPQANTTYQQDGITVTVRDRTTLPAGRVFDFTVSAESGFVVYDVIVNGGPKNNHYDYDTTYPNAAPPPGPVDHDNNLHAPRKNNRSLHNLSHINICYDVPGVTLFACDEPLERKSEGLFSIAEATIFANSEIECDDKRASFFIDNEVVPPTVTLAFQGDGGVVAGRLDVTKEFDDPRDFEDLEYDGLVPGTFEPVQWCETRDFATGDGNEFSDWLPTGTENGLYPKLPSGETACKVAENEDLSGTQVTVVYFEFEDPNFR